MLAMTELGFLFAFLPVSVVVAVLKPSLRRCVLLVMSLYYYACVSPKYFLLFVGMLIMNVGLAYCIRAAGGRKAKAFPFLLIGVIINIGILFYFKYFDCVKTILFHFSAFNFTGRDLLLPVGFSFFVFKSISLLVDVYQGAAELGSNPVTGALYLAYFGQVVSGPICRYSDYSREAGEEWRSLWKRLSEGGFLFARGFVKKVLLADIIGLIVVEVFSMDLCNTSLPLLWLGVIAYALQLYYDFSGYSDMALGVSEMQGIHCKENFHYPYATESVSDFWRRWHISLGTWFRDYVYIPLGGSRVNSWGRRLFNLLMVWLLTGIWHGANITFLFWGLGYFVAIAVEKKMGIPDRLKMKWSRGLYRVCVLVFICIQWIFFCVPDLPSWWGYVKGLFFSYGDQLADVRTLVLLKEYGILLVGAAIFAFPVLPRLRELCAKRSGRLLAIMDIFLAAVLGGLFICALSFVVVGQNNPFLYGNF